MAAHRATGIGEARCPCTKLRENLLTALSTDYVLVTGNNWKGQIGRFRFVIDKLKQENILSICREGRLDRTV